MPTETRNPSPNYKLLLCRIVTIVFTCFSVSATQGSNITAVWANDGGDKVSNDELRASRHLENLTGRVINRLWDGTGISLFGAHNEVVSFNLVLEADGPSAANIEVQFDTLTGPNGATIHSNPTTGDDIFIYNDRPIELFYARYLQIKGLSFFGYNKWDERQIPARFRRPANSQGQATDNLGWVARPDHDKFYPDPLVPLELSQPFNIPSHNNQSIWSDIYIAKNLPSGTYTGTISIKESGNISRLIHISLTVAPFSLPDDPPRAFGHLSNGDIMHRFVTTGYTNWGSSGGRRIQKIMDRYYQLFHRHRIALIGENECPIADKPCDSSIDRLDGSLFTAGRGYDGPGVNVPNGIFSIGTYGSWSWGSDGEQAMWDHADSWASWFQQNSPLTDYFLYLEDEPPSSHYQRVETWAKWIKEDPGVGHNLTSLATVAPLFAQTTMPDLDIPVYSASIGGCPQLPCDNVALNTAANDAYRNSGKRRLWAYNDNRPASGSMDTEDDGISPRVLGWSQFKMDIDKWFYWFVNLDRTSDLFQDANTWYYQDHTDFSLGYIGPVSTNGAGILAYPGTDLYNPADSYNVDGAFASVRMKNWRRGLQDYDYLKMASVIDSNAVNAIVQRVLPKTMWEISAPDPTFYTGGGNPYSSDPDVWEGARSELLTLISNFCNSPNGNDSALCSGSVPSSFVRSVNLTFTSSAVGSKIVITGSGCPTGINVLPYSVQVPVGLSCDVQIIGPSNYSFASWEDNSTANPRNVKVPSTPQTYSASFINATPNAYPASAQSPTGLHFVPIVPCRMVDTRNVEGPNGGPAFQTGDTREYVSWRICNIPLNARALSLNATVVPLKPLRWLTIWPSDQEQPFVSTLNSYDGRTKANGLIVRAGPDGGIKVFASEDTHVILDVSGYFVDDVSALTYHQLTPCRVVDTRGAADSLGGPFVAGKTERAFALSAANCGAAATAQAYALNYTAIPRGRSLGWITAWPSGKPRPTASTLNAVTGTVTANSLITQAGLAGAISVYGSDDFDLIIDVNGYFDSPDKGGDLFYSTDQCRLADSRDIPNGKSLSGESRWVAAGSCKVLPTARTLAGNLTVVPQAPLAWLTIWQDGDQRPLASNLNAQDGQIASNFFLAPLKDGAFNLFASSATHIVVDVSGYFAP